FWDSTRPRASSTRMCFIRLGSARANGRASSPTDASPSPSRARIALLVGSARAPNTWSRCNDKLSIRLTIGAHRGAVNNSYPYGLLKTWQTSLISGDRLTSSRSEEASHVFGAFRSASQARAMGRLSRKREDAPAGAGTGRRLHRQYPLPKPDAGGMASLALRLARRESGRPVADQDAPPHGAGEGPVGDP